MLKGTNLSNLNRKGEFINKVQLHDNKPLFSWIEISLTELCNRKCSFCPRCDNKYPNQNLHMSLDLLKKIDKELKEINWNGAIALCGYGEPMLHEKFLACVEILRDHKIELVTNGDYITTSNVENLYEAGIDHIQVSMYDGDHQIELFESVFKNISSDRYTLRDRWYDESEDYGLCLTNRAGTIDLGGDAVDDACFYLAYQILIDWNGDVLLCSQDWHKKVKFGNLYIDKIYDVWFSQYMTKIRRALISGNRELHPCSQCNACGTHLGGNHAALWKQNSQS